MFENESVGSVLAIHIGGAHFSGALFDQNTREYIHDSYQRVPISNRANKNIITEIWQNTIAAIASKSTQAISACYIAVPAAFDPKKNSIKPAHYTLYPSFNDFDVSAFFSSILKLPAECVFLLSPAAALLANEIDFSRGSGATIEAAIVIGTDVCAARTVDGFPNDLKWEFKTYKGYDINNLLSTQWVCQQYYKLTGISTLNIQQFAHISRTSTTARNILRTYLNNLIDFVADELPPHPAQTWLIGGDLTTTSNMLKNLLVKRQIAVKLKFSQPEQMSILKGAILLSRPQLEL